jgi:two-component system response regulator BaeR
MTNQHILIVEDEVKLASLMHDYLVQENFDVSIISHGDEALLWLDKNHADLILLDIMLPGMDGLSLCKTIRQQSDVPIFMLTARVDEIDRILGLELGADDYICKPFSPREVVARVKSLFRRLDAKTTEPRTDKLELDEPRQQIKVEGISADLTHIEFKLIVTMANETGRIFSRDQLMNAMYNDNRIVSDRTIDSHIKKLRKRLDERFPNYEFIHSVYGVGYRFEMMDKVTIGE